MASLTIRKLTQPTAEQVDRIIDVSRAAYEGDMYMAALTGTRATNESAFYRAQMQVTLMAGELFVALVDDEIRGVLMVFPPGHDFLTEGSTHTAIMDKYVAGLTAEMQYWWNQHLRPKYAELLGNSSLRSSARQESWYIRSIAVHPSYQGRGIGKKLVLDSVLKRADKGEGGGGGAEACAADVQTDGLVRWFQRFGFRVRGAKNFSSYQGGFPLFCMVREPGGVTSSYGAISRGSSGSST